MKKLQLTMTLFILLFAAVSITSCGKTDEELPAFEAKVDGADFEVASFNGIRDTTGGNEVELAIFAKGSELDSDQIYLSLYNLDPGTYDLIHDTSEQADIQLLKGTTDEYTPISGELVISSHDAATNTIKGTFDSVVENDNGVQLTITEGKFFVIYAN